MKTLVMDRRSISFINGPIDNVVKNKLIEAGFDMTRPISRRDDTLTMGIVFTQDDELKITNREHFFGDTLLADTIMLLTYDEHPRPECRLFKKTLKDMSTKDLNEWLDSPMDKRFIW